MSQFSHSLHLCVALLFAATGVVSTTLAQDAARTISDTIPLSRNGTVTIDNHEGSITVTTWEREQVQYEAQIMPTDEDPNAEKTSIEIQHRDDQLSLSTDHAERDDESKVFGFSFDSGWQWGGTDIPPVHYTLTVPPTARFAIDDHESTIEVTGLQAPTNIDTHEGPITIIDHRADVTIDSHESPIELQSVTGRLDVDTHDGDITVIDQQGPVTLSTHDGPVELRSINGRVSIDAHESHLTVEDLHGGFALDTHDGEATVDIAELTDNIRIDAHDATITVGLPEGTGFALNTDFDDDVSLHSDVDLQAIRRVDDDEINYRGPIHGGGPEIYFESDDGLFELRSH